ncbi:hypothetical protein QNO07_09265 [Streptomyces sp. 549]|uniref:hypothetical protein n=1 Tax=Streptomyces sp. 549 TaxID=3049076 RepID=UPI0024C27DE4|nr:hypothetical protein [Streptomyces sp. 549]MDK1473607.1 hypothetical protein [Streptomyces sp. 549]
MATSTCVTPIKGTHLRIVALDVCGNPVTGSSSLVLVTKGFVQVQMSPDYEDGVEFFERTADGSVCVNQKDDPVLKRYELTIDFCEVNMLGIAFITSARSLTLGSPATGTGFAVAEGSAPNRFSLEVWQEVAGAGACDPSGQQRFIYNAFPNVGASRFGDYTIENDRSTLQIMAETRAASPQWLSGLGESWLPAGEVLQTDEHWALNVTTNPPPTQACDTAELVLS